MGFTLTCVIKTELSWSGHCELNSYYAVLYIESDAQIMSGT